MDMIDGKQKVYDNYVSNTLDEGQFLEQQLKLVLEIKNRLLDIFKD